VLEDRIDSDLQAGRHGELIPELEHLTTAHPLRERLHGYLMRALYAAGRQADALEAYQRIRRTPGDELGLEPSPELQHLQQRILNQDSTLAPPVRLGRQPPEPTQRKRRRWLIAAAALILVAGAATGAILATTGDSKPIVVTHDSIAVIDSQTNRIVGDVPIGGTPRGVTVGAKSVWAANAGDGTVSQIDPASLEVVHTIGLGKAATALVEAHGEVWVATGVDDTVDRIDARSGGVLGSVVLPGDLTSSAYAITSGGNALWVGSGNNIVKIDPPTAAPAGTIDYGSGINDIAFLDGSLWIVSSAETLARFSAAAMRLTAETGLGVIPTAIDAGADSVWVSAPAPYLYDVAVWRIDPVTARVSATTAFAKSAGYPPSTDIAYGDGAIWVASYGNRAVFRLDPRTGRIVKTIRIAGYPSGIAVGDGKVWVTVS
jgi:streptogramin lyase